MGVPEDSLEERYISADRVLEEVHRARLARHKGQDEVTGTA